MMFEFIGRLFDFFAERRARKKIAALVLEEFAKTVNSVVGDLEKAGRIKSPEFKEMLKFESLAYLLWLFQDTSFAPEKLQRLLLDDIHELYFSKLRKNGYPENLVRAVCDEFALRYRTYEGILRQNKNLAGVASRFVRFLAEKSKTESSIHDMDIPMRLSVQVQPQFDRFREMFRG